MEKYINIFSALANKTRLLIFLLLIEREMCVCELEDFLGFEQSRVSHSLKELKRSGLIKCKSCGKWKIYYADKDILGSEVIKAFIEDMRKQGKISDNMPKNKL